MQQRHEHSIMTAPMFWPTRDANHAGILDIGLLGGAIYDADSNSWKFARESEGFRYTSSSTLTQMLSRERPWKPQPPKTWSEMKRNGSKSGSIGSVHAEIGQGMSYLTANNPHEWFHDTSMQESLAEDAYENFALSIYDPFQGNVCAVGSFIGLPVVATPSGPTGTDLSIILVGHKPNQQPPFALIRPKSTLMSFISPILQITAPPLDPRNNADEQILIRTRETVTIVAPQSEVPHSLARMQPEYIRTVGSMSSRPTNCRDITIHAAISPYIPNTYALVGDQGRVAIWTRRSSDNRASGTAHLHAQNTDDIITIIRKHDNSLYNQEDPWRSCIWSAHPSNLIVASRTNLELVDYRGPTATTSLFELREGETFQALQENNVSPHTPFYTYFATSHQIACVDQRFPKRPLISTSHQMGREMPCGLKTMDITAGGSGYTTVVTWDMRNAGITAYNFSHGSDAPDMEPPSMSGGAQELPSFHTHAHYTNTSELRDPLKRVGDKAALGDRMFQGIKPPLMGLAVLPSSILNEEDDENGMSQSAVSHSVSTKFSLLQYAATGAVYAQEIDMIKRHESDDHDSDASPDQILTSGNVLAFNIAQENTKEIDLDVDSEEDSRQWEIMEKILKSSQGWVAPWKKGVKEAQVAADEPVVSEPEVREHVTVDVRTLMEGLRKYLLVDRETNEDGINLEEKVAKALEFVQQSTTSVTMYEILHEIKCAHLPMTTRSALSQQVQNMIELDPFVTSSNNRVIRRKIIRTWPDLDHDISTTIRGSEATVEAIQTYLEQLYPLPKARVLDIGSSQDQSAKHSRSQGAVDTSEEEKGDEVHIWPSQESRHIRARTIRRMAQELALTTTVIVKTLEPEVLKEEEPATASSPSTFTKPPFTFKYLFQDTKDGSLKSPRIILSARAQGVLNEWYTGDITQEFTYRDLSLTEEEAALQSDAAKEAQAEALLRKRARREKKENNVRGARMQDTSYNINAKGSASQPAGIITEETQLFSQMGYADEDGMFSAPTIVAASQLRKETLKARSQQHYAARTTVTAASRNPFPFSQPTPVVGGIGSSKNDSISSQSKLKVELSPVEFKSQPAGFFSTTRERESLDSSQSTLQPESSSSFPSQELSLFAAAASQPVPGPFATKRTMIKVGGKAVNPGTKPKKKKIRTQGF